MSIPEGIRAAFTSVGNAAAAVGRTLSAGAQRIGINVGSQRMPTANNITEQRNSKAPEVTNDSNAALISKAETSYSQAARFETMQNQDIDTLNRQKKELLKNFASLDTKISKMPDEKKQALQNTDAWKELMEAGKNFGTEDVKDRNAYMRESGAVLNAQAAFGKVESEYKRLS